MKWTIKLVFEMVPGSPVEHEAGTIVRREPSRTNFISISQHDHPTTLHTLYEFLSTSLRSEGIIQSQGIAGSRFRIVRAAPEPSKGATSKHSRRNRK
jgi:hypothetical protein